MPPTLPTPVSTATQRRALGASALAGVVALIWIARPVGSGLLLGGLLAFSLQPLYERLRQRRGPVFAAAVCTLGSTGAIAVTAALLGYLFISRGLAAASVVPEALARGGPIRAFVDRAGAGLAPLGVSAGDVAERVRSAAGDLGSMAAGFAADVLGLTTHLLLTLFFMSITTHFVLRRWDQLIVQAEVILPLAPRHTRTVFAELREIGRHVFIGTFATGVAQGVFATVGYWMFGVPHWALFGILTALASLVPAVGTMLVWAPIGAYLMLTGHPVLGVLELAWGLAIVIGVSDYVLRPRLVGGSGEGSVPALLTFVALFGGVEVFGLIGFILGPMLVTLTLALVRTYYEEMAQGAASPSVPPRDG